MIPPLFGVVGWKNSGKTTLMVGLVSELTRRRYAVSVIKHAHANFEIDHPGRDSFRLREAGAHEVALSSPRRFALMRELRDAPEMAFEEVLDCAGPADLILIEGYKREAFPKIEIRRDGATSRESLQRTAPQIVAIASDHPDIESEPLPSFHLEDIAGMADFIVTYLGLGQP
jgi:molybdopterin-guanine dinucleotide biosynthesis adapter protein